MMVDFIYKVPELPMIRKARIISSDQALVTSSDVYIKELGEELKRLNAAINTCDTEINSALSLIPVKLKIADVKKYLDAFQSTNYEVYKGDLKASLVRCFNEMYPLQKSCVDRLLNVETVTLSDTSRITEDLRKENSILLKDMPDDKKELLQLKADKAKLDQAILEYETSTFIDRIQPALKALEESFSVTEQISSEDSKDVKTVKSGVPESIKSVIRLGVSVAAQALGIINSIIKYDDLRKARRELVDKISTKQSNMTALEIKVDAITDKLEQLNILASVKEPRRQYVLEAGKVSQSFVHFVGAVFPLGVDQTISDYLSDSTHLLVSGKKLVSDAPILINYCNKVQPYWLRSV